MLSDIKHTILTWDLKAWYYLNTQWHNSFFDAIIPFFRNQYFWIPLYFFLLLFIPGKYKKRGWIWCIGFVLSFALSDQTSVTLMKPYFHRLRPCNTPALSDIIHLVVECGVGLSFPSSHAANHFSMGVFSAVTLGKVAKWVWPVAIFWAALVAYSQVYVGVHFPLDVTCGGLLGCIIGIITGSLFNKYFNLAQPSAIAL